MSDFSDEEIRGWLKERGLDNTWCNRLVQACLRQPVATHATEIENILLSFAERDLCVDVDEWLHVASRLKLNSLGEMDDSLSRVDLNRVRDSIRQQQTELFPWRQGGLSDAKRPFLEGDECDFPKGPDDHD